MTNNPAAKSTTPPASASIRSGDAGWAVGPVPIDAAHSASSQTAVHAPDGSDAINVTAAIAPPATVIAAGHHAVTVGVERAWRASPVAPTGASSRAIRAATDAAKWVGGAADASPASALVRAVDAASAGPQVGHPRA